MTDSREDRCAFALLPTQDGKPPIISIGVPAAAWEKIKDGTTNTIDLTRMGIPIRVVIWGSPTYDDAIATLMQAAKDAGVPVLDERRRDFSIDLKGER